MKLTDKIKEVIYKVKDYDRLESDYCEVLDMVTGARLSKPNYTMDSVREAFSEFLDDYRALLNTYDEGCSDALTAMDNYLDTHEVKDVDFETELDRIWFDNRLGEAFDNRAVDFARIRMLCKHFFELGLKAQKGE